ncbi:MAG TPA: DUF222 domain-containing protein [Actinomycetota bacterium]|jgi:hypothetical protein|nr:DUF222 domain-containing protein [Actinomycetota bacterium]
MSTLRSALDELRSTDVFALSEEQLASDLDELEHATRVFEVERGRRVAELERRGTHARDGHLSLASWLASRHRVAPLTAAGHVRMARALEAMPVAADALASGELSSSAITLLASAREEAPEQFARAEESLVAAARTLSVEELKDVVARWRHDHADEAEDDRQELYLSPTLVGRGKVFGDLNAETTQVMITALRAVQDTEVRSNDRTDARSPARRRADALGEICRQWLDSSDRPTVAGERPHVIVTIDVGSLGRRENGPGTARSAGARLGGRLADVGAISAADALMWACDAQVSRVITDATLRPLDVGRTTRITPPWIRKALMVRDGGCAFPDCGRPPSWCDPHHVVHWTNGGPTALSNLVLLCRRHHRLIHHKRFSVQIVDGLPRFSRSDGTVLETADRAPP